MAVAVDALDQGVARLVGLERPGVRDSQHGDVHRLEGFRFVDPVHATLLGTSYNRHLAAARPRA
jgi:hypothetical protein